MTRILLALGLLLGLCWQADAATCFWVGGTGTWNTANTASWASSTGGTAGTCAATGGIPKQAADVATFDGSSGGGTVTVNSNFNLGTTNGQITCGAFTGTLDWSANNNTLTVGTFNCSGSGTRTVNTGTGAWAIGASTLSSCWNLSTATSLTFTAANTITINCSGNFSGGGQTYSTVNFNGATTTTPIITGSNTFTNLGITAPSYLQITGGTTQTVTNAMTLTGTSSTPISLLSATVGTAATLSLAGASTCTWCTFRDITVSGAGSMTATNSLGLGNTSNISITPPSTGGGGGGGGGTGGGNSFIGVTTVFGLGSH